MLHDPILVSIVLLDQANINQNPIGTTKIKKGEKIMIVLMYIGQLPA